MSYLKFPSVSSLFGPSAASSQLSAATSSAAAAAQGGPVSLSSTAMAQGGPGAQGGPAPPPPFETNSFFNCNERRVIDYKNAQAEIKMKDAKHDLGDYIPRSTGTMEQYERNLYQYVTLKLRDGFPDHGINAYDLGQVTQNEDANFIQTIVSTELDPNDIKQVPQNMTNAQTDTFLTEFFNDIPCNNTPDNIRGLGPQIFPPHDPVPPMKIETGYPGKSKHNYYVSCCYLKGVDQSTPIGIDLVEWFQLKDNCIVIDFDGHHFREICKTGDVLVQGDPPKLHFLFGNVTENDPAGKQSCDGKLNQDKGTQGIELRTWVEVNSNNMRDVEHFYSRHDDVELIKCAAQSPHDERRVGIWSHYYSKYDIRLHGFISSSCLTGDRFKTNLTFTSPELNIKPFVIENTKVMNSNGNVGSYIKTQYITNVPTSPEQQFQLNCRVQGKNTGDTLQALFTVTSFESIFNNIEQLPLVAMNPDDLPKNTPRYVLTHDRPLTAYCLRNGINVLYTHSEHDGYSKLYCFKNAVYSDKPLDEILREKYLVAVPPADPPVVPTSIKEEYKTNFRRAIRIITEYNSWRNQQKMVLIGSLNQIGQEFIGSINDNNLRKLLLESNRYGLFLKDNPEIRLSDDIRDMSILENIASEDTESMKRYDTGYVMVIIEMRKFGISKDTTDVEAVEKIAAFYKDQETQLKLHIKNIQKKINALSFRPMRTGMPTSSSNVDTRIGDCIDCFQYFEDDDQKKISIFAFQMVDHFLAQQELFKSLLFNTIITKLKPLVLDDVNVNPPPQWSPLLLPVVPVVPVVPGVMEGGGRMKGGARSSTHELAIRAAINVITLDTLGTSHLYSDIQIIHEFNKMYLLDNTQYEPAKKKTRKSYGGKKHRKTRKLLKKGGDTPPVTLLSRVILPRSIDNRTWVEGPQIQGSVKTPQQQGWVGGPSIQGRVERISKRKFETHIDYNNTITTLQDYLDTLLCMYVSKINAEKGYPIKYHAFFPLFVMVNAFQNYIETTFEKKWVNEYEQTWVDVDITYELLFYELLLFFKDANISEPEMYNKAVNFFTYYYLFGSDVFSRTLSEEYKKILTHFDSIISSMKRFNIAYNTTITIQDFNENYNLFLDEEVKKIITRMVTLKETTTTSHMHNTPLPNIMSLRLGIEKLKEDIKMQIISDIGKARIARMPPYIRRDNLFERLQKLQKLRDYTIIAEDEAVIAEYEVMKAAKETYKAIKERQRVSVMPQTRRALKKGNTPRGSIFTQKRTTRAFNTKKQSHSKKTNQEKIENQKEIENQVKLYNLIIEAEEEIKARKAKIAEEQARKARIAKKQGRAAEGKERKATIAKIAKIAEEQARIEAEQTRIARIEAEEQTRKARIRTPIDNTQNKKLTKIANSYSDSSDNNDSFLAFEVDSARK